MLQTNRKTVSLAEQFPLSSLKGDKKELRRFTKAISASRESGKIEPFFLNGKTLYCKEDNCIQPKNITFFTEIALFFDGKDFIMKNKETNLKPVVKIVTVTPQMAWDWLVYHNNKNRSFKLNSVMAYARNMLDGGWQLNPHGIVFCEDGSLADGQHRLLAIVASGVSSSFFVFSGLNSDVKKVIDEGRSRSLMDVASVTGLMEAPRLHFTTANFIDKIYTNSSIKRYREEEIGLLNKYIEPINYIDAIVRRVNDRLGNKNMNNAPLRAALSAVFYNLDDYEKYNTNLDGGAEERFEQLINVIMIGSPILSSDEDRCGRRIFEQRVSKKGGKIGSGNRREELYDMVSGCALHFMIRDGKDYRKSKKNRTLFPIPDIK